MKVAVYVEEGLQQVMFMAENDHEKKILSSMAERPCDVSWHNGSWYTCQGGWKRITEYDVNKQHGIYSHSGEIEATMLVLKEKKSTESKDS